MESDKIQTPTTKTQTENNTTQTRHNNTKEDNIINYLQQHYRLINPEELDEFIKQHTNFIKFFKEATPIIKNHYPGHKMRIELIPDPEIDNYEQVTVTITIPGNKDIDKDIEKSRKLDAAIRGIVRKHDVFDHFIERVSTYDPF